MKLIDILKELAKKAAKEGDYVIYKVEYPGVNPWYEKFHTSQNGIPTKLAKRYASKLEDIAAGTWDGIDKLKVTKTDTKGSADEMEKYRNDNGPAPRKQKISTSATTGRTLTSSEVKDMFKLAQVSGALIRDKNGNLFIKGTSIKQIKDNLRNLDASPQVNLAAQKFMKELDFHILLNPTDDKNKPQPFVSGNLKYYPFSLNPYKKPRAIGLGSDDEEEQGDPSAQQQQDKYADVVGKKAPKWMPKASDSKDAIELQNVSDKLRPDDTDVVKSLYNKK